MRSNSSGLVSIARASRFLVPFPISVCWYSKALWNAFISVFVIVLLVGFFSWLLVGRSGLLHFNLQLVHDLLDIQNRRRDLLRPRSGSLRVDVPGQRHDMILDGVLHIVVKLGVD